MKNYDLIIENTRILTMDSEDTCIETMLKTGIRSVFMRTFQDYGEEYNVPDCYLEPVPKILIRRS